MSVYRIPPSQRRRQAAVLVPLIEAFPYGMRAAELAKATGVTGAALGGALRSLRNQGVLGVLIKGGDYVYLVHGAVAYADEVLAEVAA